MIISVKLYRIWTWHMCHSRANESERERGLLKIWRKLNSLLCMKSLCVCVWVYARERTCFCVRARECISALNCIWFEPIFRTPSSRRTRKLSTVAKFFSSLIKIINFICDFFFKQFWNGARRWKKNCQAPRFTASRADYDIRWMSFYEHSLRLFSHIFQL